MVVRSEAGLVVWWLVLVGAIFALIPATRPTRTAWVTVAFFAGFVVWTGLAVTWPLSSERSLQELSRVAMYLSILALGIEPYATRFTR